MTKIDSIVNILKDYWSNGDLISLWNDYCDKHRRDDDTITDMSLFDDLFGDMSPLAIVRRVKYGDFRPDDDYFAFNGYGNLVSFNDLSDYGPFSYEALAEYLVDNGDGDFEVDTDMLQDYFIEEYFADMEWTEITALIDRISEDEPFDLLMDDWDDLAEIVKEHIKEA
jgi:hypothetical protein